MVVKMNHANQWQWHMEQTQRLWVCKWENLGQGFCSNMPIKWLESAIESMRLDRKKKTTWEHEGSTDLWKGLKERKCWRLGLSRVRQWLSSEWCLNGWLISKFFRYGAGWLRYWQRTNNRHPHTGYLPLRRHKPEIRVTQDQFI